MMSNPEPLPTYPSEEPNQTEKQNMPMSPGTSLAHPPMSPVMIPLAPSDKSLRTLELQATLIGSSEAMTNPGVPQKVAIANAAMKLMAAQELGLPPVVTASTGMWIIERSLCISARTMLALLLRSKVVQVKVIESTEERCEVEMSRTDMDFSMTEVLTLEQAHARGLTKSSKNMIKSNWERHPKEMLWARVISFLARRIAADIIGGLYVPEDFGQTDVTARVEVEEEAVRSPLMLAHKAEQWRIEFLRGYLVEGLHLDEKAVAAQCKELRDTMFGGRLIADLTVDEANELRDRMSQWALQQIGEDLSPASAPSSEPTLEGEFNEEDKEDSTADEVQDEDVEEVFANGAATTLLEWQQVMEDLGCDETLQYRLRAYALGLREGTKVLSRAIREPENMTKLLDVTQAFLSGRLTEEELPGLYTELKGEGSE